MKDQLQLIIELMRKHVLRNLELIKNNESHIREVLTWEQSVERTKELNDSYKYSKTLLSENNDYINLQVSIMNFVNKYQNKLEGQSTVKVSEPANYSQNRHLSRDEFFRLTIGSNIPYNSKHPYFNDDAFFNELLAYFQQIENYEMCADLLNSRK